MTIRYPSAHSRVRNRESARTVQKCIDRARWNSDRASRKSYQVRVRHKSAHFSRQQLTISHRSRSLDRACLRPQNCSFRFYFQCHWAVCLCVCAANRVCKSCAKCRLWSGEWVSVRARQSNNHRGGTLISKVKCTVRIGFYYIYINWRGCPLPPVLLGLVEFNAFLASQKKSPHTRFICEHNFVFLMLFFLFLYDMWSPSSEWTGGQMISHTNIMIVWMANMSG